MSQPNVELVRIIKFGSEATGPIDFKKDTPLEVEADMGGTNFIGAITLLIDVLKNITDLSKNYFVMFLSDGEDDPATGLYEPLKQ